VASFADSVKANSDKILQHINKKCYSIVWQLFTSIVYKTPVLKGELINSWYPKVGKDFSSEKTTIYNKSGAGSLARIKAVTSGAEFLGKDGVITMANNLDYSYRAEVLGWPQPLWSGEKGPYRMVALSIQQVAAQNK
jgi:hypothetical protein